MHVGVCEYQQRDNWDAHDHHRSGSELTLSKDYVMEHKAY